MSGGVIVGIGSELGVDRIGLDIVDALANEPFVGSLNCSLYRCCAPARTLPSVLPGAPWALLIDAVRAGGQPGTALRVERDDLASDQDSASSHGIGVSATLALLDLLGELPNRTVIVAIEVGSDTAAPPSAWIDAGCQAAATALEQLTGMNANDSGNQTLRSPCTDSAAGTSQGR